MRKHVKPIKKKSLKKEKEQILIRKGVPKVVNFNRKKKLDVIIVSVNYNDLVLVSLTNNVKLFENITVVTSSEDTMCQTICNKFGVKCVVTDKMYEEGSAFKKGKAINEGIRSIENPDFILILDADIVVKNKINLDNINEDSLLTSDRWICKSYELYKKWENGDIKLEEIGRNEPDKGIGFFQLFNINNKNIDKNKPYPETSNDASFDDLLFRDKFVNRNKIENNTIIHLGDPYTNWNGRVTNRFLTDDNFSLLFNRKSTFTICSYYFNYNDDIRQKRNFIKFLEQWKDHYENMIVGIVDYGDIDFEIPCEKIVIEGDVNKRIWSKEIIINKIVDKIDTDYILWIDGDLIYENLDWLRNLDKVIGNNDFVQLFETINYLGEDGEILESHKSLCSGEENNVDFLLGKGFKPGGSWMTRTRLLKSKPLFDKMLVGGGDTILAYGIFGVERGWTLERVKEGSVEVYEEAKKWISEFGKRKCGYLSVNINHLYHGDLSDRNYNDRYIELNELKKIDINSYLPEFGYELISILPYSYKLYKEGKLGKTISGLDTKCLYFFNSENHIEVEDKRGWHNMPKLWNVKFPNIGIHTSKLDFSKFEPPPLKDYYYEKRIKFEKETIVVCNRYNMEWGGEPINYLNLDTLSKIFNLLKNEYQIIYINLNGDERYYDDAPPMNLGDFEMIRKNYNDDVIIIQDLLEKYKCSFNQLQLRIFAGCSKFITSNGGQSILASYFGGENIIFTKKCREILPEVNSFYRWYHKFGNSIIKVVNKEDELIDIILSKWIKKDPLINILIRTCGRPNYFKSCIESIYNQTYKNWNIIVGVDDDDSLKYVQEHKSLLVRYDMSNVYIEEPPNSVEYGIKFKYNLYFNELHKYVQMGYIMYLDDDDMLYNENSLQILSNSLIGYKYDLCFYRVKFPNRLVPCDDNFSKKVPVVKDISGIGFIFKNEIKIDWEPYKRGDFRVSRDLNKTSKSTLWLNEIITSLQRKVEDGFGKRDDK